jgi:hypothetical protein
LIANLEKRFHVVNIEENWIAIDVHLIDKLIAVIQQAITVGFESDQCHYNKQNGDGMGNPSQIKKSLYLIVGLTTFHRLLFNEDVAFIHLWQFTAVLAIKGLIRLGKDIP